MEKEFPLNILYSSKSHTLTQVCSHNYCITDSVAHAPAPPTMHALVHSKTSDHKDTITDFPFPHFPAEVQYYRTAATADQIQKRIPSADEGEEKWAV